jgi:hypothetical protein
MKEETKNTHKKNSKLDKEELNRLIKLLWKMSKIKAIEDKIVNTIDIPIFMRQLYCLFSRVYTHRFYKDYAKYNKQIIKLHNIHKDERCFIVGMGPSLNKTDFSIIKDETLFGVNALYEGLKKFDINLKYWVVSDIAVFDACYKELLNLDTTLFLAEDAGRIFLEKKHHYLKDVKKEPIIIRPYGYMGTWNKFSKDLTKGAYGGMVILSCLQVAYYLGFKEVYLLGCDCDWTKGVHFNELDKNNFNEGIEGWLETFKRYGLCKKIFKEDGRTIYNSTPGGRLEVFERKSLEDLVV